MAQFETLTNAALREEIQKVKNTLDGSPVKPHPMVLQLMGAAMTSFRKANETPLEGEDPEEHAKLLEEFDEFTAKYKLFNMLTNITTENAIEGEITE